MATYLLQRNKKFYYRRRIPRELERYFPKMAEIRIQFGKKTKIQVMMCVEIINTLTEELFTMLQSDTIKNKIAAALDGISNINRYADGKTFICPSSGYELFPDRSKEHEKLNQQLESQINDLSLNQKEKLLGNLNALDNLVQIIDVKKDFQNTTCSPTPSTDTGITFKNLYDMFISNKAEEYPDLAKTTWRDYQSAYNDFLFVVADAENRDIASFTKDDFKKFSDALHNHLPKSRTKKQYKNYTYDELIEVELQEDEKLARDTKKKKMALVRQMFDIAVDSEDITISENLAIPYIVKDIQITKGKTARQNKQEKRKALSEENLTKLFSSKLYTDKKDYTLRFQPEKYWIPILALYTGMRQNEICQLKISDIKQEKISTGELIYYFELNENEDKHLKNENAYRCVPIHPKLINLGFIKYYNSVKNKQHTLWSNLRLHPTEERYNADYNKSFMTYFRKHITDDKYQVFHSFRHNVGGQLLNNAVKHKLPKDLMLSLLGQEPDKDQMTQTYSNGYSIESLYEGIKSLRFDFLKFY